MRFKKFKSLMLVSLILLLSLGLVACVGDKNTVPTLITAKDELVLLVGDTGKLSASVNYEAKDKTLTFISNDNSKITIDKDTGKYEALAVGNTSITITAFDGTKKTVNVIISRLATDIECTIKETETIIKDNNVANTYYVIAKTVNENETFAPIDLVTKVLPSDAKQMVEFSVNNPKLAKVENSTLIINLPKVNESKIKDVVLTMKVDNISKEITFKVCPFNASELSLDFNKGKDKSFNASTNTMNIYVNNIEIYFSSAFSETYGNITYVPNTTFKIVFIENNKTIIPTVDYERNSIKVSFAGEIAPKETKVAKFVVTDTITGQVWEQTINIKYDV